jgi:hypothetical protein
VGRFLALALAGDRLEIALRLGREEEITDWLSGFRKQYSRFPAFQMELRAAMEGL